MGILQYGKWRLVMFDFKFDWEKNLNTSIESIDVQHKQLFKLGRDMEQLLQMQCIGVTDKQLLDIVCGLRDFTAYHFYAEETIMDEMSYPKITKHKQFHKKCSDYIMQINIPKLKQEPATELRKIEEEVQSWVMDHVLNEDMEMAKVYLAYRKTVDESKQKTTEKDLEDIYGAYVADLDISRVYLYRDQTCRGRVAVVFKESARELCRLSTLERNMFFADIATTAKTLNKLFAPDAINYFDSEDYSDRLIFHVIPKYKENGTYGVPQTLDKPCLQTDNAQYDKIYQQLKEALQ